MRLLTRWWFAALLVGALLIAWAVTLAPWAPWHERTAAEVRLHVRPPADHPQTATSSSFVLPASRTVVTVSMDQPDTASALPKGFMASVDWVIRRAQSGTPSSGPAGNAVFTGASPGPVKTAVDGESFDGLALTDRPAPGLRLIVTGVASSPATFVVRVTQTRGTVAGVSIPLVLVIACIVLIGLPATTARSRRRKPVVFPPSHEHY